jgi:hypothetical protein
MHQGSVSTGEYEFSHGKRPRGYGLWAFCFDGGEPEFAPQPGNYSEACKWAISEARRRLVGSVKVAP